MRQVTEDNRTPLSYAQQDSTSQPLQIVKELKHPLLCKSQSQILSSLNDMDIQGQKTFLVR